MRVLVADNDLTWRDLLELDLRLEGFEVVATVDSAAAARELLARTADTTDVLVSDHRMPPGLTGLELVEAVHRDHPRIRSVLFTNYELGPAAHERIDAAGAAYVAKPDLRLLREAIKQLAPSPPPGEP